MEAGRVMSPEIGIDLQEEYDEEEEDMEMQMEYAETEDVEVEMLEDDEEDGDADDESVDPISQFQIYNALFTTYNDIPLACMQTTRT